MSAAKRNRTANFSLNEKMKFLQILQKKGQVIINKVKTTDARTNRKKEAAWKVITHDLNASGRVTVRRTTDHLKKLWQKMKTQLNKKNQLNANNERDDADPVLELVGKITSSEIENVNFVYKEEHMEIETPILQRLCSTEVEVIAVPPESESDRLWPIEAEEIVSPEPKTPLERLRFSKDANEAVAAKVPTQFKRPRPAKAVVTNVKPNKHTQLQKHLKRRWPLENDTGSMKDKLDASFVNERLQCEKEKGVLIALQKQHMAEEFALTMNYEQLKTTILEVILKKIQDEKAVNTDLMKIASNM